MSSVEGIGGKSGTIDLGLFTNRDERALLDGVIKSRRVDTLTIGDLRAEYGGAKGAHREMLARIINRAREARIAGTYSALQLQAGAARADEQTDAEAIADRTMSHLNTRVHGQASAKAALDKKLRAGLDDDVLVLAFPGPSGTGKTEFAKALMCALHPDDPTVEPVRIEGQLFKNPADLSILEGAAPGYLGSDKIENTSPMSAKNIAKATHGRRPMVVLIDEPDDINPAVRAEFWAFWNKAFDEGYVMLKDGTKIDLAGCIFVVASNAGLNRVESQGLTGQAALSAYVEDFCAMLPTKILNRVGGGNIIPFEPHTLDSLAATIQSAFVGPLVKKLTTKYPEVTYKQDDDVTRTIARIALSDLGGARPARDFVKSVLKQQLNKAFHRAANGGCVHLSVKPDHTDAMSDALNKQFKATKGVPQSLSVENSPFQCDVKKANREFRPYLGSIPLSPIAEPIIHASGAFAGDGFLLYNAGETSDANKLVLLQDGPSEAADRLREIPLPDAVAKANLDVKAVALSMHELAIVAVHVEPGSDEATVAAFIYDHRTKKTEPIEAPPIALVGATLVNADGRPMLAGGRPVERDEHGYWSVSLPAERAALEPNANPDNGVASQDQALMYDRVAKTWEPVGQAVQVGRSGMSAITIARKVYFVAGEETEIRPGFGTAKTVGSTRIDELDLDTMQTKTVGRLPLRLTRATPVFDVETSAILLVGGSEVLPAGSHFSPKKTLVRIPYDTEAGTIDTRQAIKVFPSALPSEATGVACIARADGYVAGPFRDAETGELHFAVMT